MYGLAVRKPKRRGRRKPTEAERLIGAEVLRAARSLGRAEVHTPSDARRAIESIGQASYRRLRQAGLIPDDPAIRVDAIGAYPVSEADDRELIAALWLPPRATVNGRIIDTDHTPIDAPHKMTGRAIGGPVGLFCVPCARLPHKDRGVINDGTYTDPRPGDFSCLLCHALRVAALQRKIDAQAARRAEAAQRRAEAAQAEAAQRADGGRAEAAQVLAHTCGNGASVTACAACQRDMVNGL